MKKLSKEASFNLRAGFGSLISNNSCIEAGKNIPFWVPLILALIAAFMPVVPIMVNLSRTNGDSFISGTYTYSFDRDAAISCVDMTQNGTSLILDEQHYLSYYKTGTLVQDPGIHELTHYINNDTKQYEMITYFMIEDTTNKKTVDDYYKIVADKMYKIGGTVEKQEGDDEKQVYYQPTLVVYYKDGMAIRLNKLSSTDVANRFGGNFVNVKAGDLVSRLATVEGVTTPTKADDVSQAYEAGVYQNYKNLLNDSYSSIKANSFMLSTVIYYSIYFGLILLLGFLIFALTRGKRNFNNYLKWYQCMCISGWASITPGILALVLGFLLTNFSMMFFILLMGVRVMWMSMKQLSPNYQGK